MNENPKYVVIPWELAVSIDETLDMDLRMASIYDGDDIDGSGIDYGDEAEGILEDRKALRKAMAKAMEEFDDVYYVTPKTLTGYDHETSVDGTHPSDMGYLGWARSIEKPIQKILKKYGLD